MRLSVCVCLCVGVCVCDRVGVLCVLEGEEGGSGGGGDGGGGWVLRSVPHDLMRESECLEESGTCCSLDLFSN